MESFTDRGDALLAKCGAQFNVLFVSSLSEWQRSEIELRR